MLASSLLATFDALMKRLLQEDPQDILGGSAAAMELYKQRLVEWFAVVMVVVVILFTARLQCRLASLASLATTVSCNACKRLVTLRCTGGQGQQPCNWTPFGELGG